jgi:hypothetical protein
MERIGLNLYARIGDYSVDRELIYHCLCDLSCQKPATVTLDIELFISEIKKRPALYNTKLKEYSGRNLKHKLWIEICEQFVENWNDLSASEKANKGQQIFVI